MKITYIEGYEALNIALSKCPECREEFPKPPWRWPCEHTIKNYQDLINMNKNKLKKSKFYWIGLKLFVLTTAIIIMALYILRIKYNYTELHREVDKNIQDIRGINEKIKSISEQIDK